MSIKFPAPQPGDVLELVHTIMHKYRALQYRFLRDGPHEITHMDGRVLHFFGAHPGATQKALALRLGRDKAQLARLVKGLRDIGLLEAQADLADGRSVKLSLTAAGQAVRAQLQQQSERLAGAAVTGLSVDEQAQLRSLLGRVDANLDADCL
ncbi:MarR family winged helix-turn-helix transcriptional regulator [Massilia sp. DWR3-1-1]|uniref:MarR family winged helix-turn-helix transcriptional regulator n=1 Tax=Massilia sp. DWR3-1-1 TaxID=2804559 RepID=UPI003CEDED09